MVTEGEDHWEMIEAFSGKSHESLTFPYWKPTQVGQCESTQVLNEGTLRNSAK